MTVANVNALWSRILLDALVAMGVRHVALTPGSRSTPLTLGAHHHPALTTTMHVDERAAAFFALGVAKATLAPVALVCTSGTAAANYLPAVVEAALTGVPLVLLTADRPLELRGSGAAQTIDQVRLFGDHVRHYLETPAANPELASLRRLRAAVMHAVALALGDPRGPVHLNVPFDEPLAPVPVELEVMERLAAEVAQREARIAPRRTVVDEGALRELASRIMAAERGLIVVGPEAVRHGALVHELARRSGFPVLADIASGMRFVEAPGVVTVRHPEIVLRAPRMLSEPPDLVIRLGQLPTSSTLERYLTRMAPYLATIQPDLARRDPEALAQLVLAGDVPDTLDRLAGFLPDRGSSSAWRGLFMQADRVATEALARLEDAPVEATAVRGAIAAVPEGGAIFLASSMAIRYAEALCHQAAPGVSVHVNRGANGIDGIVSSALGVAHGTGRPTLLVTGDLALLHDLGGLVGQRHTSAPFVILLLNNDGGGIFSHLPVAGYPDGFEECFGTPHGLRFAAAGLLFGLAHSLAATPVEAVAAVTRCFAQGWPGLIEVPAQRSAEAVRYRALLERAAAAVDAALAQPLGAP